MDRAVEPHQDRPLGGTQQPWRQSHEQEDRSAHLVVRSLFFGPALPACLAWCWCLDAQRAVARLQNTHAMRATRAQHTHTHAHTTHYALRRKGKFALVGNVETPKYLPDDPAESIARRSYLRVLLAEQPMPQRAATVWQLQLSHIKTSGRSGTPSFLGGAPSTRRSAGWLLP